MKYFVTQIVYCNKANAKKHDNIYRELNIYICETFFILHNVFYRYLNKNSIQATSITNVLFLDLSITKVQARPLSWMYEHFNIKIWCILFCFSCHNSGSDAETFLRLLPNYFVTYTPIATVMLVCPVLYLWSIQRIRLLVTNCLGQVTKKERGVITSVRLRFGLINLAFYVCWLPNLINGIIIWVAWYNLPAKLLITLWYMMVRI